MTAFASSTVVTFLVLLHSHGTAGQPARSTTPGLVRRPTPLIIPGLVSQPAPSTTPRLVSQPAPSTTPGLVSQPAPSTTPGLVSQPARSTTPGLVRPPTPLITPGLVSQPEPSTTPGLAREPTTWLVSQPALSTTLGPIEPCQVCCSSVDNITTTIDQIVTRLERQELVLEETTGAIIRNISSQLEMQDRVLEVVKGVIVGNISSQMENQERVMEETKRAIVANTSSLLEKHEQVLKETITGIFGNISAQLERQALALELLAGRTICNGSVIQLPTADSDQTLLMVNITTLLRKQDDELKQLRMAVADVDAQQKNFSQVLQALIDREKGRDDLDQLQSRLINEIHDVLLAPTDCMDLKAAGKTDNGVYRVVVGRREVNVSCDMKTTCGGWLVFQRRKDGSENFQRKWSEYASGFGDLNGEFWLGNEILHLLTKKRRYMLRIDLENFNGEKQFAQYSRFYVASSADYYRLTVGDYSGNAGDSLSPQDGQQFSTRDVDRDKFTTGSCAKQYSGAWWYNDCHYSNLNGKYLGGDHESYADGIEWYHWHGFHYSLKTTEMKIAPLD